MNNSGLSQAEQIRRVEAVVASTKFDSRLLELIDAAHKKSGRPRQISVRAFLVALLVVGMDGREHLVRVVRFLNSLDARTRMRLGVARSTPVTRRQVDRMNQVIVAALEKAAVREGRTKWEMLDRFRTSCCQLPRMRK